MHPIHLLLEWILYAVGLLIAANAIPGFEIKSFGTAMIAALVIGLINITVGPILRFLTFPITFLTLGLFLFVIDAIVLKLASMFAPGFKIKGFVPALLAAVLLAVMNFVWHALLRL